ncbi:hypothetical protein FPRO05_02115 [Fusarium proliferatum]|uniref:DOMON domain-containing protein n=1 Tax=Gibberella intermedia TaxID=948311 RepID=A0A365N9A1_GIBIN|nr:hypothetical protein FPRO05_02115 [Fusarium proliferatum]
MLLTVLLSLVPLVAGAAQYCQFEGSHHPLTLCAAVNSHQNSTTSSTDWIITFGYQRVQDAGWVALGIGSGMYGALMFVTYANKSSRDLVLSVRRGLGYYEPEPIGTEPQVVTNAISVNGSGWFEVTFTCYQCSAWSSVTPDGSPQPWIWAANVNQVFSETSVDSPMEKHGIYGHFSLDISEARGGDSRLPHIDFTAANDASNTSGAGSMSQWPTSLFAVHGALMVLSTMIALGYLHHSRYRAGIKTPKTTGSHRWIGRLVIVGGCINALIGIQMADESTILIVFTVALFVIDMALLAIATRSKVVKNREVKAKSVGQDEDSRPFLGTNED